MLWFRISVLVTVVGRFVDQGGIGSLASSESESELELSLGGPGGLEMTGMNLLGSLEIPSSEKGLPGGLAVQCSL